MSRNDGGPAYPAPEAAKARFGDSNPDAFLGMSLRDYFAANSLPALLQPAYSDLGTNFFTESDAAGRAELAYAMADAMLAARSA